MVIANVFVLFETKNQSYFVKYTWLVNQLIFFYLKTIFFK